jgi:hypothetical protein
MSVFGKRQRCLPEDWAEIDHLTLPLVKEGTVLTYVCSHDRRMLEGVQAAMRGVK